MAYQPNYGEQVQPMPTDYGRPYQGQGSSAAAGNPLYQPGPANDEFRQLLWDNGRNDKQNAAMDPANMYQQWDSQGFIDPRDQYDEAVNWEQLAADARESGDENRARQLELTYGNMSENEKNNLKQRADAKGTSDTIFDDMMSVAKQVISGEYHLPESMETDITDSIQSIRGPVMGLIDGLDEIAKSTGVDMKSAITKYETELQKTGSDMMTELSTAMEKAKGYHSEAVKTNRDLANMNFDEISEDISKQMMHKSAMMGRSTTDPAFNEQMAENLSKVKSKQELGLAQFDIAGRESLSKYEAENRLGITERTGSGMEQGQLMRGQIDEKTGAALAGNQQQRVGFEQQLGNQRENMRWNMRTALPQQQMAMAGSAIEAQNRYLYGMPAERIATAMAPVTGQQTGWMREQMGNRQGSTSTAPGWGSAFGTAIGVGASAASKFLPV